VTEFEPVIGLEVHAQLHTATKLFCGCATRFGDAPNVNVCPVCLGLPGALPVLNREAIDLAIRTALVLGCEVHERSVFARKNYFYPDLPKGYQISQYEEPLSTNGALEIGGRRAGIVRVHVEEDAGKSVHLAGRDVSLVDCNRAGVPLAEIVGAPDLLSPSEAAGYLRTMRLRLLYAGVCDGNMEEGSLRCDANVSVRPVGTAALGTKVEIKNLNSVKHVERALEHEIARQTALLSTGGRVVQETRLYREATGETAPMRSKEDAHDYRYFPDPDLPPLHVDRRRVEALHAGIPELAPAKSARYLGMGLSEYDAGVLTSHPRIAAFFEAVLHLHDDAKEVSNFVQTDVLRETTLDGLGAKFSVSAERVAALLDLVRAGTISRKIAKEVFADVIATGREPRDIVEAKGLEQVSDAATLEAVVRRVVDAAPGQAVEYRAGKAKLLAFFVGRVMKETRGRANPERVNEILLRILSE